MAYKFTLPRADVGPGITPASGAKLEFFVINTTVPLTTYSNFPLTVEHTNPVVSDANGVFPDIFLDSSADVILTDKDDVPIWGPSSVYEPSQTISAVAADTVVVSDSGGNFDENNVENVLAEIVDNYASNASGQGASKIGIQDAAGNFTGTEVEAALAELAVDVNANFQVLAKFTDEDKATDTTLANDNKLQGFSYLAARSYSYDIYIHYNQNVGDIKFRLNFSSAPQRNYAQYTVVDSSGTVVNGSADLDSSTIAVTTMTDGLNAAINIRGGFVSHASTAGALSFQWAQNTSNANDTTVFNGSWMQVRRTDDFG